MPKLLGVVIFLLMIGACTPAIIDTPVPTQTLIPPTITPTATPIIPTPTPQNLPEAQSFILTPSPTPLRPLLQSQQSFDMDVISMTRSDLALNLGVQEGQLQLVEVLNRFYYAPECSLNVESLPSSLSSGYEVVWVVNEEVYSYLTWGQSFVWCDINPLRGKYLTAIDPIAAELSALAIRRVQQQLDTDDTIVELSDVVPVQWRDSSLGCPQEGSDYAQALIDGYRIIVTDGETSYLFHTDSVQLVSCDFASATR